MKWIFFDLDETLMVEAESVSAAFQATGRWLGLKGLEPVIRRAAEVRWRELPGYEWCNQIGCSYWEGLSARFEGSVGAVPILGALAESYRLGAWREALEELGDDPERAADASLRYKIERDDRHLPFPDAKSILKSLSESFQIAILTNGLSCHQREKLDFSGLSEHVDLVLASGDIGIGKPDPFFFSEALRLAKCLPAHACMIGDSLANDIAGAQAVGMRTVWVNRSGGSSGAYSPDRIVGKLAELNDWL